MSRHLKIILQTCRISAYSRTSHYFEGNFGEKYSHAALPTEGQKNIENIRSVTSIENKSRELIRDLALSKSFRVSLIRLELLVAYLKKHRLARKSVNQDHGIYHILNLFHSCRDPEIRHQARIALALLGYIEPVRGRGIRILALDGGGTRGIMTIEMLKEITDRCGQPIHELFDYIIGTSTGAVLAVLLGVQKHSLSKCGAMYERLSREIFTTRKLKGTAMLLYNQSYYDTHGLERIFKDEIGDSHEMIDSAAFPGPKVAALSTIVNYEQLKTFVFRTYHLPKEKDDKSFYQGTSKYKFWQAIRASTAAPGFFEEILLDGTLHQDGALLNNNPTAVAIHEAKLLWPTTPIQTIVSLGTGTFHGTDGMSRKVPTTTGNFTSRRDKLKKLVYSATDVEATHQILKELLPMTEYIRLNPNMSADIPLDVSDVKELNRLRQDTRNYIDKFENKFDLVSKGLLREKTVADREKDHYLLQKQLHIKEKCFTDLLRR